MGELYNYDLKNTEVNNRMKQKSMIYFVKEKWKDILFNSVFGIRHVTYLNLLTSPTIVFKNGDLHEGTDGGPQSPSTLIFPTAKQQSNFEPWFSQLF